MELITFYLKLLPLYLNISLGWGLGKYLGIKREQLAKILIYVLTPIIVFNGIYTTPLDKSILLLPGIVFFFCFFVSQLFLILGKYILKDTRTNLLAFSLGNGNTGYFGIPLVYALFGDQFLNTYIFANLGITLFENTFGVYYMARGNYTIKQSFIKLLKLPALYALSLALIARLVRVQFGEIYQGLVTNYRGAYATLGVMLIGLALADIDKFELDKKLLGLALTGKFIVWPIFMGGLILLDTHFLHILSAELHKILLIISIVPLPGNAVAYASLLKIHPEKAAVIVFISTIIALIYIPLFILIFLS